MLSGVEGKTVLVSGVGPGLGREIAEKLLRDGANVVVAARSADRLAAIAGELDPTGDRVEAVPCDITDADGCTALVDAATARFGSLDGLVHCAAYDAQFGGIEHLDMAQYRDVYDVNVFGTLQLTHTALPAMRDRGGAIVFIGTQSAYLPNVMQLGYASSKASLHTTMHLLAVELGKYRIRSNMVVATWMWGPPVEGYVQSVATERGITPEAVVAEITANMPLGVIPEDGDVAEAVAFLCSDRARTITGQTLFVNSGEYLH